METHFVQGLKTQCSKNMNSPQTDLQDSTIPSTITGSFSCAYRQANSKIPMERQSGIVKTVLKMKTKVGRIHLARAEFSYTVMKTGRCWWRDRHRQQDAINNEKQTQASAPTQSFSEVRKPPTGGTTGVLEHLDTHRQAPPRPQKLTHMDHRQRHLWNFYKNTQENHLCSLRLGEESLHMNQKHDP